jgi:hypothetical protein
LEVSKRRIAQILANSFFCNFCQNTAIPYFNFDMYNERVAFFKSDKNNTLCPSQVIQHA